MKYNVIYKNKSKSLGFADESYLPSWQAFNKGVVQCFPELTGRSFIILTERGEDLQQFANNFEAIVGVVSKFIIRVTEEENNQKERLPINEKEPEQRKNTNLSRAFGSLALIAGGAALACLAAPVAIAAVGFGSAGVVGGSMAVGIQSAIGLVAKGSLFASLQSAGAAGLGAAGYGAAATAGGVVGAAVAPAAGRLARGDAAATAPGNAVEKQRDDKKCLLREKNNRC